MKISSITEILVLGLLVLCATQTATQASVSDVSTDPAPTTTSTVPSTDTTTVTPDDKNTTTSSTTPTTTSTTTEKPTTTSTLAPNTTSTTSTTTEKPTTSTVPPTTTSTVSPSTSTLPPPSPVHPSHWSTTSFIGGMVFAFGMLAIGFVSWKFYKARNERNYHTL